MLLQNKILNNQATKSNDWIIITSELFFFTDEGHGFRKLENKQKALDGEYYFYSVVLGFNPADQGIEVKI